MSQERELAQIVALAIKSATAPLVAKIAVLEARPVISPDVVEGLKDTIADLRTRLIALDARAAVPGPVGPMGAKGDRGEQGEPGQSGVAGEKGERGERGPAGAPGLDGKDGVPGLNGKDGVDGKDGAPGLNGKDGADGKAGARGVDGKDGAPGLNGKDGIDGKDGATGVRGADGNGITDAMIDRAGQLVLTFSNGQTKAVGLVVGKDGANGLDGQPGRDVDPVFVQNFLEKELAKWPRPKDGVDGKDGAPGLSPDDFDWSFNPETRELSIAFSKDGKPVVERAKVLEGIRIYRGVYEAGRTYEKGDVTSWDGSEWTAMDRTKDRPGNGATPWKLTVKHGEKGPRGAEGKPGRDGRDLTQLGTDGRKW